jgi:hypothetical protein
VLLAAKSLLIALVTLKLLFSIFGLTVASCTCHLCLPTAPQ